MINMIEGYNEDLDDILKEDEIFKKNIREYMEEHPWDNIVFATDNNWNEYKMWDNQALDFLD